MSISCGYCGASMPDISEFCPQCGRPVREGNFFPPEPEHGDDVSLARLPVVEWDDRIFGALAYLTFLPAVVFIFLKQYQRRKFVRFHAFQSVLFWGTFALLLLVGLLASTLGFLFLWLLAGAVVLLALFFIWVVLSIKALQGEWFELPWLGALAGQHVER